MKSFALALTLLALTHAAHAADEVKFRTSFETSGTILRNIVNEACIDGVVYLVFQSQGSNVSLPQVSTAVTPKLQASGKPATCTPEQNLRH
ncbi:MULTISPECIES: hypothetical protein [Deefgea]|uniref:Uncharacterized protein n=1 Tax=Deefgea chitinilytica TaxID=570276 RepID=A0ABS2CBQ5_9NEIS|nr:MULTISPECIES: hypothetical protein [Deefgea]MBM5571578.1 hypothetical protein [Deefgea chitinilytica]MBM9888813.1 hypothetical protein [Deefgea sp. CFH1-16]